MTKNNFNSSFNQPKLLVFGVKHRQLLFSLDLQVCDIICSVVDTYVLCYNLEVVGQGEEIKKKYDKQILVLW